MTLIDSSDRTVLVVDDEANIRELCSLYLEQEGFGVITADDGVSALAVAREESPDLIVLDLMLPKKSGYEVTRELRADTGAIRDVPILMLTARSEDVDRIVGLELGADDYLGKPFHPRELTARVKAILRRAAAAKRRGETDPASRGRIEVGPLIVDWDRREATLSGNPVETAQQGIRTAQTVGGVSRDCLDARATTGTSVGLRILRRDPHCRCPRQPAASQALAGWTRPWGRD